MPTSMSWYLTFSAFAKPARPCKARCARSFAFALRESRPRRDPRGLCLGIVLRVGAAGDGEADRHRLHRARSRREHPVAPRKKVPIRCALSRRERVPGVHAEEGWPANANLVSHPGNRTGLRPDARRSFGARVPPRVRRDLLTIRHVAKRTLLWEMSHLRAERRPELRSPCQWPVDQGRAGHRAGRGRTRRRTRSCAGRSG